MSIPGFFIYGAVSAGTTRMLQHVFPTPLEKAQLRNLNSQIDLARERLIAEEARASRDIEVRRELLAEQLAHQQTLQEQRIDADLTARGRQKQLDAWPLAVPASSILATSRRRALPTLNVIVKVTGKAPGDGADSAARATRRLDIAGRRFFGNDVLVYGDVPAGGAPALIARSSILTGQALVSAVSSLLDTEPSVLIEISVVDGGYLIDGAFWGWPCEPETTRGQVQRTPAPILLPCDADAEKAEETLLDALLLLIAGIQDAFVLLNRWDSRVPLRMFGVIAALRDREDRTWPGGTVPVGELSRLIGALGASAPPLAAEAAAGAALDAHAAGQDQHATALLHQALVHARAGIVGAPEGDEALIRTLMAEPPRRQTLVQRALTELRGVRPEPEPPPMSRARLSDISTNAARRLRGSASS